MDDSKPFNALFLCTGNSARSILAEAIMNRLGAGKFKAYSAGSMPAGRVNPYALSFLQKLDYPTEHLRSKPWDEFSRATNPDAPELDFVFTVCDNAAGEVCPYWPGQPATAHWGYADPSAIDGSDDQKLEAFRQTLHAIHRRLELLVNLPAASVDKLMLQDTARGLAKA